MDYALIIGVLIFVLLSTFLLSVRAFDVTGTIVALLFGVIILTLKGKTWFFILLAFLLVSLYATYYGKKKTDALSIERRGVDNVISNGLVAFMTTVFSFPFMFLGSVSAALSDTLSSEIGVLSKGDPRLITDLRKVVPKGTNGGISPLGTLAAAAGAVIIAALAVFFAASFVPKEGILNAAFKIRLFIAVFTGGFMGSISDSFLGILENRGLMTKGSVNFMATLIGGAITAAIMNF